MTKEELFSIKIDRPDEKIYALMKAHFDALAKPIDGMGEMENLICRIGAIRREVPADLSKKVLAVFCADTFVTDEGVSQTGREVTKQVAALLGQKKSTAAVLAKGYPLEILPVDIGIDCDEEIEGVLNRKVKKGAGNIAKEAAMTEEECLSAVLAGMEVAKYCKDAGFQIAATGEMGIGNTTTSTALYCALTGENPAEIAGRGAGLSDAGLKKKIEVVKKALVLHGFRKNTGEQDSAGNPETTGVYKNTGTKTAVSTIKQDAFRALRLVGGLDLAGLTGFYIGCALNHTPVVIDGFISAVSGLVAEIICPGTKEYMIASHKGREKGSQKCLSRLGLSPVIDANLALGEGTGAILLLPMADMVYNLYINGTTFSDAQIDQYERFMKI